MTTKKKSPRLEQIVISGVSTEMLGRIDRLAEDSDRSRAGMVRVLLARGLACEVEGESVIHVDPPPHGNTQIQTRLCAHS